MVAVVVVVDAVLGEGTTVVASSTTAVIRDDVAVVRVGLVEVVVLVVGIPSVVLFRPFMSDECVHFGALVLLVDFTWMADAVG